MIAANMVMLCQGQDSVMSLESCDALLVEMAE